MGMELMEIPKGITIKELSEMGRIYLWIDKKNKGEGIIIDGRKLIKVGENEANYLYQEAVD